MRIAAATLRSGIRLGILLLAPCLSAVAQTSPRSTYPDVWDWAPRSPAQERAFPHLLWMPDGDVLVSYQADLRPTTTQQITFFGRQEFRSVERAYGGRFPPPDDEWQVSLPNGRTVSGTDSGDSCDRGLGSRLAVHGQDGAEIISKAIVVVLTEPIRYPAARCEEEDELGFSSRLAVMRPNHLLPLADNTFLVADSKTGMVIRLDADLQSRSALVGKRIFILDPKELERQAYQYPLPAPQYGLDWPRFFEELRSTLVEQ